MLGRVGVPGGKNARRNLVAIAAESSSARVGLIDVCWPSVYKGVHADALMRMVKEGEHQSEIVNACVCHSGHTLVIL